MAADAGVPMRGEERAEIREQKRAEESKEQRRRRETRDERRESDERGVLLAMENENASVNFLVTIMIGK